MSGRTLSNWLVDAVVFCSAVLAMLTGVYFLYLPSGGYQGGRNPAYGVIILFDRHTWDTLHTWGGAVMIAAAALHFALHWSWVVMMARRLWRALRGQSGGVSRGARVNCLVDAMSTKTLR